MAVARSGAMTAVRSQKSLASFLLWRSSRPEDVVALADGGQRPRGVVWVGADQQVDAGAPYLLPLAELVELGARSDQHLAGPQLLISARRTPVGSPSVRKMRTVLPVTPASQHL
jgi:hypothetical protein